MTAVLSRADLDRFIFVTRSFVAAAALGSTTDTQRRQPDLYFAAPDGRLFLFYGGFISDGTSSPMCR